MYMALITGSSSGIGAATAILFAKSGANVVVTGRNAGRVSEVAKQCLDVSPDGLKALEVVADVTRDEDLQRLVDTTFKTFGRIDIVVNNAGIALRCAFDDPNYVNVYRNNIKTDLDSVVFLTHICVKHLEKTKGNIINISSIRSVQTAQQYSAYCMSKSALDMFTKCLAAELGPKGIRVNSVNPGVVRTNILVGAGASQADSDQAWEPYARLYPVGRYGDVSDIAHAVVYLASDESSFITGTALVADGGHLAANGLNVIAIVSYNFAGKVALITGSSSGIGAATAILFAKSGANVVVTGRNAGRVSEVAKQCLDVSPDRLKALEVVADVTSDEDLQRLVDTTIKTFGKIDILVNNAGIALRCAFDDPNYVNVYRNNIKTDLDSVVFLTHICVKHLEKTKGNVINISSVRSVQTRQDFSAYCMSKSALDMFTKCIAAELGTKGIRVNNVNPGAVRTNIAYTSADESAKKAWYDDYGKLYPVGRVGEGYDMGNAVLYLASDESSFITGTVLVADGGHLAANVYEMKVPKLLSDSNMNND
ncbi:unnamed protein product [Medioppia subpectinata]|uniref:Uncharacterized protein n=1 Tax=Medioppia subpectinata TaxID=1979941 RepID=A0A7R9KSR6_9ACAR|nr:unnamed protein product [Medioppia subpectinata]CAG2109038.1 unnamed protein product [Medioppia subpectinata]